MPRYYDVFVPPERRADGCVETVANEVKDVDGLPEVLEVSPIPSGNSGDGGEDGRGGLNEKKM